MKNNFSEIAKYFIQLIFNNNQPHKFKKLNKLLEYY